MRAIEIIFWLSLVASTATAVDGVLEINKTCAVETGCLTVDTVVIPSRSASPGATD